MNTLSCIETHIQKNHNHYGCFIIEPLEVGQGITLGNTLRRTLLSDLYGYGITGVRINNVKHEFAIIEGIREDVLELILNLKEVTFKGSAIKKNKKPKRFKGFLHLKGPMIVTAGLFQLPNKELTILNPSQYLCTIIDDSELYLEIDIENGKGYRLIEENRRRKIERAIFLKKPTTLFVDTVFVPIKHVNYKVKLIHDSYGNIKESLIFEIGTNGSFTPKRCIKEALKIILKLFYSLFLTETFFPISKLLKDETNELKK
jgi:DNA-directed RNA polymerase subunit alpha